MRKQAQYIGNKGMNQDMSISKFSPEFTYKNMNIRINSTEDNSLFTMTNERGTALGTGITIQGTVIGHCVLNDYLVLFTTNRDTTSIVDNKNSIPPGTDWIYRIEKDDTFDGKDNFTLKSELLFEGTKENSLNFSKETLIETIGIFESEKVQKVYWVDKNNSPRFINIVSDKIGNFNNNDFEFVPKLRLNENVEITKQSTGGSFHSGVIQYAFSYWNSNGVESNIFETTPLYYITQWDRAGSPEEICNSTFTINVTGLDNNFEFLRVYSIHRTSLDTVPSVKIVKDISIGSNSSTQFIDNGRIGSTFNPLSLLFIGGDELIVGTIAHKDNVLFGGEIRSLSKDTSEVQEYFFNNPVTLEQSLETVPESNFNAPYTLDKNSQQIKNWKFGETYRPGIQLQFSNGNWSDPIWLGEDVEIDTDFNIDTTVSTVSRVVLKLKLGTQAMTILNALDVKYIRPVYVPLTMENRSVLSQGFLTNTIFKVPQRIAGTNYAYPDYFTRANMELYPNSIFTVDYYNHYPLVSTAFTVLNGIKQDMDTFIPKSTYHAWRVNSSINPSNKFFRTSKRIPEIITLENESSPLIDGMLPTIGSNGIYYEPIGKVYTSSGGTILEGITQGFFQNVERDWELSILYDSGRVNIFVSDYDIDDPTYFRVLLGPPIPEIPSNNLLTLYYKRIKNSGDFTDAWAIDKNLLNFWSPETELNILNKGLLNNTYLRYRSIAQDSTEISAKKRTNSDDNILESDISTLTTTSNYFTGDGAIPPWPTKGYTSPALKTLKSSRIINYRTRNRITPFTNKFKSIVKVNKEDSIVSTSKYSVAGVEKNIAYVNHPKEVIPLGAENTNTIMYKGNNHLLLSLIRNSEASMLLPEAPPHDFSAPPPQDYMSVLESEYNEYFTQYIDKSVFINYANSGYLWVADLVKDIENQYGGETIEDLQNHLWIPCGKKVNLEDASGTTASKWITFSEGDTFIQRYNCLRVIPAMTGLTDGGEEAQWNQHSELVSLWIESFVNLEGRYDSRRETESAFNLNWNNFNLVNNVYSQENNFFNYNILNYKLLNNDYLPNTFLWSSPKIYSSSIDSWTSLKLANSYTVDGSLGKINKIINYNNELYGFQDKGLFQILYNSRIQINPSDGMPIEIAQSEKTEGVRYLSKTIGASNKWAIKASNKSLYFISGHNKSIYMLGEGLTDLSEELGFKSWSYNNLGNYKEFNLLNNTEAFTINVDTVKNDVYFNNKNISLGLSERLSQFESFYSYNETPFMFNIWGEFLSIKEDDSNNTTLWFNHKGKYNQFFGENKPSEIEFYLNPDSYADKVFDNFQYRADFFATKVEGNYQIGDYLPRVTFEKSIVNNEFQKNAERVLMTSSPSFGYKKFRQWSFPFPRQTGSLNRIRNPWVSLKLTTNNNDNRKIFFHDLIINYTI